MQVARRMDEVEASAVREILKLTQRPEVLSLAGGLPAAEMFDVAGIRAAFDEVLSCPDAPRNLQYTLSEGDPELRSELASLSATRGIEACVEGVLVTTGSQQALDLALTALVDPGDVVLVERPCYLAALQLFALSGVRVIGVESDEDGLLPEAVAAAVVEHSPRLIYTVSTFQNPTGVTMSLERRQAIAALAEEHDVWVVEDDPYGELRYRGSAVAPLATFAPDRVLYLSSLSKILAPGLRLGWMVVPEPLRAPITVAKQAKDLHTSTIDQRAAARYLASGRLMPHLEQVRDEYGARLQTMLDGLGDALPEGSQWTRPEGGMFVWATLPRGWNAMALLEEAVREGVAFVPGVPFYAGEGDPATLRMSFVTVAPDQISEALARLGRAVEGSLASAY